MKIAILGNYGHRNLGDEALLLGALECACRGAGLETSQIVVLSDDQVDTSERLSAYGCEVRQLRRPLRHSFLRVPLIAFDIFSALDKVDHLVMGGGGLINDANRTAVPIYALVSAIARLRGISVSWWAVGIGPLKSRGHRQLARWLLRTSQHVSVRDAASARLAYALTGRDYRVIPDLAHGFQPAIRRPDPGTSTIAISIIPFRKVGTWFESEADEYDRYCARMSEVIGSLLRRQPDARISLFPVSLDQDAAAIDDICALFATESRVGTASVSNVSELISELQNATVVVATRLHSVVLSTVVGVPAVTIAYQAKVRSYAEGLEGGFSCHDITEFEVRSVVKDVLDAYDRYAEYYPLLTQQNKDRYAELMGAMQQWRQMI